jgi:hypothetical protein
MAMPRLPEFIRSFFSKAKNSIGGFLRRAEEKTAELRGELKKKLDTLFILIPLDRRVVLTVAIGVPVIMILVVAGISMSSKDTPVEKPAAAPVNSAATRRIPSEDLFIPEEPDFVPGVLLEREKREQWSVDDAMPWWQDPLKDGDQEWRDQIEKTVDEIMENVQ